MILKKQSIYRAFTLFLLLFFLISMFPMQSLAANDMFEGEIELTGNFNGRFSLDSSDIDLFNLKDIVPGDTWRGKLHVKNKARASMDFSIISIVSNLEDNTLFDALDLKIYLGDEEIYNGSYGSTGEPISDFYKIKSKQEITFDLIVSLPRTAGNNVQNKKMDSTWTFEANYYGSNGGSSDKVTYSVFYVDEYGNELLDRKIETGTSNSKVTEIAPDIDGYYPDAEEKSIVLRKTQENKIVFVYYLNKHNEPTDPSDPITPPDSPDEPTTPINPDEPTNPANPDDGPTQNPSKDTVKTGVDMTGSNSTTMVWLLILGLLIVGSAITYYRIGAEKRRIESVNSNKKGGNRNVKE